MPYSIIQPPFTLKFRGMSDHELANYPSWFLGAIPARMGILQSAVIAYAGFENWRADYSRASLGILGSWLTHQVETRLRSPDETDRIRDGAGFAIDVSEEQLSNRTFSLAMDVGMYFGETLLRHYPNLEWHQPLNDRKFADFGQMVLLGFGKATLNPVRIAVVLCYGIASGKQTGERLVGLYEYWSKLASSNGGLLHK